MNEEIIHYYNRVRKVYEIVKPLNTEATTIHTKQSKEWVENFLNFAKDTHGLDKEASYQIEDRGSLIKFQQGKLTIWFQL